MSGDPPPGEKPRGPKPVAVTSSFINKGGKIAVPKTKVVRRRPGAGAAAASKPSEPSPSATPVLEQPAPELPPTPAATQETVPPPAPNAEKAATEAATAATEPSNAVATESSPTLARTPTHVEPQPEEIVERPPPLDTTVPEPTAQGPTQPEREPTPAPRTEAPTPPVAPSTETDTLPTSPVNVPSAAPAAAPVESDVPEEEAREAPVPVESSRPKRRRLPWNAVNAPRDNAAESPSTVKAKKPGPKRKKKGTTLREIDEDEEDGEETRVAQRQQAGRARGKRSAAIPGNEGEGGDAQRQAKKPRKTRSVKRKTPVAVEGQVPENEGGADATAEPPRKRQRRKRSEQTEPQGEGEQPARRQSRPAREATPPGAENETIDPSATFMDSLATRNITVGKLSNREKKMREINWEEVKQRRREMEMAQANSGREDQAEITRRLNEEAEAHQALQHNSGPQMQLVDGQIVLVPGTGTVDPEAAADRDIDQMEVVNEDDLTTRINYRSFMRNNKRFPQDFLLPGQGKRWNFKDTEDFYAALTMFGTDFMMIASLFPGTTRRSVKTKFVREERLNPQRIKDTLHGRRNFDWDQYLANSGLKDDSFVDPREIDRQLAEERERMAIEIQAAKEAADEEQRQRRLAGVESEEEAGDQENTKGKKKRQKVHKQVSFEPEEGVEVLGGIDEDDGWGRE